MGCIIIAMSKIEDGKKMGGLLTKNGYPPDLVCSLASEVLSESSRRDNGVVICGNKLPDMSFIELKECLPSTFEIVILSKNIMNPEFPEDTTKLATPFQMRDLVNVIETFFSKYYKKGAKVKHRTVSEQKAIDDAKKILMDRNGMTEAEAYRYIQKSSMDSSRTIVEMAQMIVMLNYDR